MECGQSLRADAHGRGGLGLSTEPRVSHSETKKQHSNSAFMNRSTLVEFFFSIFKILIVL